jgi:hypothetical protein
MTSEKLAELAGILLSLAFSYVPGLREKYDALDGIYKRLIMGGALLVVAGAVFGLSCAGIIGDVVCTEAGAVGLVRVFIAALIANQATYLLVGSGVPHTA